MKEKKFMIKLFGLLDIGTGIIFLIKSFNFSISLDVILLFVIYIGLKGVIFLFRFGDAGSFIDVVFGLLLLSSVLMPIHFIALLLSGFFLIFKGIASFL